MSCRPVFFNQQSADLQLLKDYIQHGRYTSLLFKNLKSKRKPLWLNKRLFRCPSFPVLSEASGFNRLSEPKSVEREREREREDSFKSSLQTFADCSCLSRVYRFWLVLLLNGVSGGVVKAVHIYRFVCVRCNNSE
jgi:hypothetical protein